MYYISNLPGNVTGNILSHLSTKDAVRSSVLAKAWKYKWTSIRSVVDYSRNRIMDKAIYLDSMVKTLHKLPELERFLMCCGKGYDLSLIEASMDAVFSKKVNSFEFYMLHQLSVYVSGSLLVLPSNLLDCKSLEKMILALPCLFKAPSQSFFPNLKDLELRNVKISNPNTNTVFIVFPVLERFEICQCQWCDVKAFGIHAPKLVDFLSEPEGIQCHEYSIEIVQAKIETFTLCGGFLENIKLTASTSRNNC